MKNNKLLSISILISSLLISGSIFYYTIMNRYEPVNKEGKLYTFDKFTATYYNISEGKINQIQGWTEAPKK